MRRIHRLQKLAAAFLLAQVAIGYAGWFTPRREVFPFTSWLLFSLVPDRITDYELLLHGSPEFPQEPPRPFNQSGGLVRAAHSIVTYQLVQQLGEAVEKKDDARAAYLRQQIEEQFAVRPMRYDLIRVSYQVVARWKTGQVISRDAVRAFVSDRLLTASPDSDLAPSADTTPSPVQL